MKVKVKGFRGEGFEREDGVLTPPPLMKPEGPPCSSESSQALTQAGDQRTMRPQSMATCLTTRRVCGIHVRCMPFLSHLLRYSAHLRGPHRHGSFLQVLLAVPHPLLQLLNIIGHEILSQRLPDWIGTRRWPGFEATIARNLCSSAPESSTVGPGWCSCCGAHNARRWFILCSASSTLQTSACRSSSSLVILVLPLSKASLSRIWAATGTSCASL